MTMMSKTMMSTAVGMNIPGVAMMIMTITMIITLEELGPEIFMNMKGRVIQKREQSLIQ